MCYLILNYDMLLSSSLLLHLYSTLFHVESARSPSKMTKPQWIIRLRWTKLCYNRNYTLHGWTFVVSNCLTNIFCWINWEDWFNEMGSIDFVWYILFITLGFENLTSCLTSLDLQNPKIKKEFDYFFILGWYFFQNVTSHWVWAEYKSGWHTTWIQIHIFCEVGKSCSEENRWETGKKSGTLKVSFS